jgi:dTDP-4-dehydrorhamnose 3,5-epimerase
VLRGDENSSLWIPKGFAHGFQALTNNCIISYSVSGIYSKSDSRTINPTCKYLGIEWPIENNILSENDSKAFSLGDMLDQEIFF